MAASKSDEVAIATDGALAEGPRGPLGPRQPRPTASTWGCLATCSRGGAVLRLVGLGCPRQKHRPWCICTNAICTHQEIRGASSV
eukprot:6944160-Pyramimonas_sp.AAC.1